MFLTHSVEYATVESTPTLCIRQHMVLELRLMIVGRNHLSSLALLNKLINTIYLAFTFQYINATIYMLAIKTTLCSRVHVIEFNSNKTHIGP